MMEGGGISLENIDVVYMGKSQIHRLAPDIAGANKVLRLCNYMKKSNLKHRHRRNLTSHHSFSQLSRYLIQKFQFTRTSLHKTC